MVPSFYEFCQDYYGVDSNIEEWNSICVNDFYMNKPIKTFIEYKVKGFFSNKNNKFKSNNKLDILFHLKVKEFEEKKTPIPPSIFSEMDGYLLSGDIFQITYIAMDIVKDIKIPTVWDDKKNISGFRY